MTGLKSTTEKSVLPRRPHDKLVRREQRRLMKLSKHQGHETTYDPNTGDTHEPDLS